MKIDVADRSQIFIEFNGPAVFDVCCIVTGREAINNDVFGFKKRLRPCAQGFTTRCKQT